jgi:hypothetical protein
LGSKVEQGETQNAAYSQIKNKVKFVWMSLPKSGNFKVSYYIDLSEADNKDIKSITGNFSYLDNDVTKKLNIEFEDSKPVLAEATQSTETSKPKEKSTEEDKQLIEADSKSTNDVKEDEPTEEIAMVPIAPVKPSESNNTASEDSESDNTTNESDEITKEESTSEESVLATNIETEEEMEDDIELADNIQEDTNEGSANEADNSIQKETEPEEPTNANETSTASTTNISSKPTSVVSTQVKNTGVRYRVQVAAGKNVVGPDYFQKKHNFSREFNVENHQGWVKYTTGSFSVYRDARNSREEINGAGHEFDGPFVTAYNEGTRITVQEALMITSQKWFK